jgi:DNA-directed RNA polymerase subunit RPC12/RpoP
MNRVEAKIFPRIGLRPYRCEKCGHRYIGTKRQRRDDKIPD